jgi:hypothetical protein
MCSLLAGPETLVEQLVCEGDIQHAGGSPPQTYEKRSRCKLPSCSEGNFNDELLIIPVSCQ